MTPSRPIHFWLVGAAVAVLILLAIGAVGDDTDAARAEDNAAFQRVRDAHRVVYDIRDCPRTSPGESDLILLHIRTQADMRPVVSGCTRIVDRAWLRHESSARQRIVTAE